MRKRIFIRDYRKRKEEIDEFCRIHLCGYEIYPDGTAVILLA